MVAGLQLFDPAGNEILNPFSRVGRVLGSVYVNGTSGSLQNDGLLTGEPFASFHLQQLFYDVRAYRRFPRISVSGNTLSWYYPAPQGTQVTMAGYIVFGVR
ncbi:hypothetical protein PMO31116_02329 [Pandoraea morbifera]|jgi:hypothetical protein|uniref:Uncharacterized protein n=1 Tax=Pandoraea morbifera TaxID=2508300 RepID=A0A5E4V044_9BURK|nr:MULTISPECIES: hypothetical protein [Pandoraea]ANC42964.1 hypothetical protein A6P55_00445 [Pandoraea pnomenusa]VVE05577.1 hypothetical protein PMO31116_02329 [Pandoraea morbifera]